MAAADSHELIHYLPCLDAGIDPMMACTSRSYPRHTHDQYGVGVVDSGCHSSWSGRGQVEAGPGSMIAVNPGEVHDGRAIAHRSRAWRMLYLEPATLTAMSADIHDGAAGPLVFTAPVFIDSPLRKLFDTAFSYATSMNAADAMARETALLRMTARLSVQTTTKHRSTTAAPCIDRARQRIDDDPALAVSLQELADEAGISRYQLLRGFAREFGLTPHAYILQRRLEFARRLLKQGASLVDAAIRAGFYDQSHFTRCFTRQFGATPRRYVLKSR